MKLAQVVRVAGEALTEFCMICLKLFYGCTVLLCDLSCAGGWEGVKFIISVGFCLSLELLVISC